MSTSSSTTSPITPGASISYLPPEILHKIATFAKAQDEAYEKLQGTRNQPERWKAVEELAKLANEWYGRSVNSLFMVNKEWNAIMAPFVFEMIYSDGHSAFSLRPVSRHSSHFRTLCLRHRKTGIIDGEIDPSKVALAIEACHLLPIVRIELDDSFAEFFNTLPSETDLGSSFEDLAERITSFTAVDVYPDNLVEILSQLKNLVTLRVISEELEYALVFDAHPDFLTALQDLQHLKELAFVSKRDDHHFCAPKDPELLGLPGLLSLEIDAPGLNALDFAFISTLRQLRSLSITTERWYGQRPLPTLVPLQLKELESLNLDAPGILYSLISFPRSTLFPSPLSSSRSGPA